MLALAFTGTGAWYIPGYIPGRASLTDILKSFFASLEHHFLTSEYFPFRNKVFRTFCSILDMMEKKAKGAEKEGDL